MTDPYSCVVKLDSDVAISNHYVEEMAWHSNFEFSLKDGYDLDHEWLLDFFTSYNCLSLWSIIITYVICNLPIFYTFVL